MEELEYKFVTLTLPNIQFKIKKDRLVRAANMADDVRIMPHVKPFVEKLAMKHPQWQFINSPRGWHRCHDREQDLEFVEVEEFDIYANKELLGSIGSDHGRNGARVFTMTNERIQKIRERGSATKTKDLDKAIKIFGKMFGVKSMNERIEVVIESANNITRSVFSDRHYAFSRVYDRLGKHLQDHIMDNLQEFTDIAITKNFPQDLADSLPNLYAEFKTTEEINKCLSVKKGDAVLIHGNDYAVTSIDEANRETKIYSTDALPPHIKRGVGMLKLVEKEHFISGIGIKISDTSFYIIPEVNNG